MKIKPFYKKNTVLATIRHLLGWLVTILNMKCITWTAISSWATPPFNFCTFELWFSKISSSFSDVVYLIFRTRLISSRLIYLRNFGFRMISDEPAVFSRWEGYYPISDGVLEISDAGFNSGDIHLRRVQDYQLENLELHFKQDGTTNCCVKSLLSEIRTTFLFRYTKTKRFDTHCTKHDQLFKRWTKKHWLKEPERAFFK